MWMIQEEVSPDTWQNLPHGSPQVAILGVNSSKVLRYDFKSGKAPDNITFVLEGGEADDAKLQAWDEANQQYGEESSQIAMTPEGASQSGKFKLVAHEKPGIGNIEPMSGNVKMKDFSSGEEKEVEKQKTRQCDACILSSNWYEHSEVSGYTEYRNYAGFEYTRTGDPIQTITEQDTSLINNIVCPELPSNIQDKFSFNPKDDSFSVAEPNPALPKNQEQNMKLLGRTNHQQLIFYSNLGLTYKDARVFSNSDKKNNIDIAVMEPLVTNACIYSFNKKEGDKTAKECSKIWKDQAGMAINILESKELPVKDSNGNDWPDEIRFYEGSISPHEQMLITAYENIRENYDGVKIIVFLVDQQIVRTKLDGTVEYVAGLFLGKPENQDVHFIISNCNGIILAHEFGHFFGISTHPPQRDQLMYSQVLTGHIPFGMAMEARDTYMVEHNNE